VWFRKRVESGEMELLEAVSLWSALTRTRQMVLVGEAGCGKTTAALFLALALTTPPAERQHPKLVELAVDHSEFSRRLPVLVRLREERARRFDSARDVEAMLRSGFDGDESGWDVASRYLDDGRALLLLDGLDELDTPDSRKALARVLGEWQRERRRSGNLILVTSRPTA
jgi:predicted NACHT family NTPase